MQSKKAGAKEWWGLAVLALPTLLVSMDVSVLHLAIPHVTRALNPSPTQTLWIIDAYGFLLAAFLVTMGVLGDRIGRRKLLLIGGAFFGIASVCAAFSPMAEALIASRAVMGIAAATLMPSTLSLIMTMFEDEAERGQAIGIWVIMFSVGAALGPVIGGLLLTYFWWGSVFLPAIPVVAILLIAGPRLLPEARVGQAPRVDLLSTLLLVAGTLLLVQGIKSVGNVQPIFVAGTLLAAIVVLAFFARRQLKRDEPMLDVRLLKSRSLTGCLLVMTLAMLVAGGTYLFVTQYLQMVAGLNPIHAGLWLIPSAILLTVTAGAAAPMSRKFGPRAAVAVGLAISLAGHSLIALSDADSLAQVIVGFTLAYGGGGPLIALGTDIVMGVTPPERAGAASAMSETGTELGMAMGVAILGSVGAAVYSRSLPGDLSGPHSADAQRGLAQLLEVAGPGDEATVTAARSAFAASVSVIGLTSVVLSLVLMGIWMATVPNIKLEQEGT